MRMRLLNAMCLGVAMGVAGAQVDAAVLYQETFDNTTDQAPITNLDGWNWAVNDGAGSNTGNRQFGLLSSNAGVGGDPGFAYNFSGVGARAILAWYDDAVFSQSDVTALSAFIGHSNAGNETRFAVRIETIDGPEWFVTTAFGTNNVGAATNFASGAIEFSVPFTTDGAQWRALAFDGLVGDASSGFDLFNGAQSGMVDDLPAGDITAVGVYSYTQNNSVTRLDNFTVVPEPASLTLLTLGGLAMLTRRRG